MADVVFSGPLLLALAIAALAGLVSFASPCVLPLVPGFLGFVGGMAPARGRLLGGTVLFVLGFSAVFVAMGVVLSSLTLTLQEHQGMLLRVGGVVVAGLGVLMLTQPSVSWGPRWRPAAGLAGAPVLGVVFGLGFSACSGPVLVAIQTLGASLAPGDGVVTRAVLLGVAYCLGLGVPFLLIAAGAGWASRSSRWLRRHHSWLQRVGGGLLLVIGLLMVAGIWEQATAWVQTRLTSTFETVI